MVVVSQPQAGCLPAHGVRCFLLVVCNVAWPNQTHILHQGQPQSCVLKPFMGSIIQILMWQFLYCLQSWRSLFTRRYMPQLLTAFIIQFFQQFTGINAIIFCEWLSPSACQ